MNLNKNNFALATEVADAINEGYEVLITPHIPSKENIKDSFRVSLLEPFILEETQNKKLFWISSKGRWHEAICYNVKENILVSKDLETSIFWKLHIILE